VLDTRDPTKGTGTQVAKDPLKAGSLQRIHAIKDKKVTDNQAALQMGKTENVAKPICQPGGRSPVKNVPVSIK